MYELSYSLPELKMAAATLLQCWKKHGFGVLALYGEMGAGKTTLARQLVHEAGCIDEASSPTYSLANAYAMPQGSELYHMDWYRLKSAAEVEDAGLEELLYSGAPCLVEWPDRAEALLPPGTLRAKIVFETSSLRKLVIG